MQRALPYPVCIERGNGKWSATRDPWKLSDVHDNVSLLRDTVASVQLAKVWLKNTFASRREHGRGTRASVNLDRRQRSVSFVEFERDVPGILHEFQTNNTKPYACLSSFSPDVVRKQEGLSVINLLSFAQQFYSRTVNRFDTPAELIFLLQARNMVLHAFEN